MVEIMTDKATVEIPAPRAGRVGKRMFQEGQLCPVGKVLITIELAADDSKGTAASATTTAAAPASKAPTTPAASATSSAVASGGQTVTASAAAASASNGTAGARTVLATPATRKLARDLGVDIRTVAASGPNGRVTSTDVREHQATRPTSDATSTAKAAPAAVARQAGDVRLPFRGVRRKIAEHLVHSKHTAAHFTYVEEIDCTDLVVLRTRANERLSGRGVKLSFLPFFIKATVAALQKFPALNATLDEAAGEIVQRRSYHIGLATATDAGLIVPVVRDADRRSLVDLAQEIDRLAESTRLGKTPRDLLSGSTFTISSLGPLGGVLATPIINYPEVAILAPAKMSRRPAVRDGEIVIRDLMNLSISVDHRVVDGHEAAKFMAEVKASLETPGLLFLESV